MTKMKKKLLLIVSLCLIAVSMFGCGSDANATYGGYTVDELADNNQGLMDTLMGMSDEDLLMYQMNADQIDEGTLKLVNSWMDCKEETGAFVGYSDFTVTEANGTITAEQTCDFADRDLKVTFIYDKNMQVTDITLDRIYTMGETMAKAGMNTAMGMGTVFFMLIAMSLIISCFRFIGGGKKKPEAKPAAPAAPVAAPVVEEVQDDFELVAVIAAAIAAATGTTTDDFVVRSIKRR